MYDKRQAEEYIIAKLNISKEISHISELKYLLGEEEGEILIVLCNEDIMLSRLGLYGKELLDIFYDLANNIKNISFGIVT